MKQMMKYIYVKIIEESMHMITVLMKIQTIVRRRIDSDIIKLFITERNSSHQFSP